MNSIRRIIDYVCYRSVESYNYVLTSFNMTVSNITFFLICLTIVSIPFLMFGSVVIYSVFAQTPTTVQGPSNSGNLKFQEQKAFIYIPPDQQGIPVQIQPQLQQQPLVPATAPQGYGLDNIINLLMGSGIAAGITKLLTKKTEQEVKETKEQVKDTKADVLTTKLQQKDLAKFTFDANKDKAEALNGTMPSIQLKKLEDDIEKTAEKNAKA